MSRVNIVRTVIERVRITGPLPDVDTAVNRLQKAGGYRWISQRMLPVKGGRMSETRCGATLERVRGRRRSR